ncbi:hypothetical protein [Microbacterium sp. LBN7]|uniref:hypothetical protein n=1 Tax=Microbacterium sp. LBN7 TaxID=3129773 RepID=UPI00325474BD
MVDGKTLTRAQAREAILALLDEARELVPSERPAELPGAVNGEGVYIPGWHSFEHVVWRHGSDIWGLLTEHPALRDDDDLCEQIIAIVTNPAALRGRQSFILACGSVKFAAYAPQIASQLGDPDVEGQALSTLIKMRAGAYAAQVRPLLDSPSGFIHKFAKRYLARYEGASDGVGLS